MPDVIITVRAEADSDRAVSYYHRTPPLSDATRWLERLLAAINSLAWNPERFPLSAVRARDGSELRERLFGRRKGTYRILYRVTPNAVFAVRVVRATVNRIT